MLKPKLFDVVALLDSVPFENLKLADERYNLSSGLAAGTVGTVVKVLPQQTKPTEFLVEFSDSQGCGYAFATLPADSLLVLHYTPSDPLPAHQ